MLTMLNKIRPQEVILLYDLLIVKVLIDGLGFKKSFKNLILNHTLDILMQENAEPS